MMAPGGPSSRRTPEDSTTPRHTRTSPIARVRVLAGVVTWRDAIRRDYNQHVRSTGGHAGESSTNEPDGATRPRHTAASASDVVSLRAAMKILFIMRHSGYVRNFESTLRLLCDRGHHVHLAFHVAVQIGRASCRERGWTWVCRIASEQTWSIRNNGRDQ